MSWKKDKLGNHLILLTDYHANGSYKKLKENVTLLDDPDYAVMIRTTNFEKGDFKRDLKYINEHAYNFLVKSKVYSGDILMNKIANAGSVYLMPNLNRPVSLAMNLFLLRTNPETTSQKFIYYYLKCNEEYIKLFAIGAAANTITKENVRNLEIEIPPITIQTKIASILSAYDDLIENNTHRIQILEQMAQTIYKEWFVSFRFPDHENTKFVDSPLGKIPKGWEVVVLGNILKLKHGFAFKGKDFLKEPTNYIAVSMGNFREVGGLQFEDNNKYLVGSLENNKFLLKPNDLVMVLSDVTRAGRIIGNVGTIPNDERTYYLNQRVARIELDEKYKIFFTAYFSSQLFKNYALSRADSATVLNLSNDHIYKHEVILPSNEILLKFIDVAEPIMKRIQVSFKENYNLRRTRDLLLPKLMSGEVEV